MTQTLESMALGIGSPDEINRRTFLARAGAAAAIMVAAPIVYACGSGSPSISTSTKTYTLRISTGGPLTNLGAVRLALEFKKQIEASSNGRISVQAFDPSTLGTVQSVLDQVKDGAVHMMTTGPVYAAKYFPDIQVVNLPFLFSDRAHFYGLIDGGLGSDIAQKTLQRTGLRIGGWSDYGFYNYINRRHPITTLEDLKGLKLRVQPTSVTISALQALGGIPVSLDFGEVYTSMQSGAVDGTEVPEPTMVSLKFIEIAKYVSEAHQYFSPQCMFMNDAFFRAMPPDLQKLVDGAVSAACGY